MIPRCVFPYFLNRVNFATSTWRSHGHLKFIFPVEFLAFFSDCRSCSCSRVPHFCKWHFCPPGYTSQKSDRSSLTSASLRSHPFRHQFWLVITTEILTNLICQLPISTEVTLASPSHDLSRTTSINSYLVLLFLFFLTLTNQFSTLKSEFKNADYNYIILLPLPLSVSLDTGSKQVT